MKRIFLLASLACLSFFAFGQQKSKCEHIAEIVFEAVSTNNFELIEPYLSPDFTTLEQKQPTATLVLRQMLGMLGKVNTFTPTATDTKDGLTLHYKVDYEKVGEKEALFVFDQANKIKRLELAYGKAEVKTLKPTEQVIEYNIAKVIEVPFTLMGKLIVVKAMLNGVERDFILDSGAPFTILNAKHLDKEEGVRSSINDTKGVSGTQVSGMDIQEASVDFYGSKIDQKEVITLDISALSKEGHAPIYGLIGYDFLKAYDVLFDYKKKTITLIQPEYFETYKTEVLSKAVSERLPIEMEQHIPVLSVKIADNSYKMGIDCGAESALLDVKFFASLRQHKHLKRVRTDSLTGIARTKKAVNRATVKKMYIGNTLYKRTQVVFSDISHLNQDKTIKKDGLLGYTFLSKQPTLISYKRKEVLLF